jgi:exonuclease III
MRIISLNTLGGALYEPLIDFVEREALRTDIFCLQEMYRGVAEVSQRGTHFDLFEDMSVRLPEFVGSFVPAMRAAQGRAEGGEALFVRASHAPTIEHQFIISEFDVSPVNSIEESWPIVLQWCSLGTLSVAHLHGLPQPGHKLDTPMRLEQSAAVAKWVKDQGRPVVVCGDFNLMPNTESIGRIEQIPLKNLIKEFDVRSTRPMAHLKKYEPEHRQYFADYIFASPELKVNHFEVPDVEISDHLPLIVDVEIE